MEKDQTKNATSMFIIRYYIPIIFIIGICILIIAWFSLIYPMYLDVKQYGSSDYQIKKDELASSELELRALKILEEEYMKINHTEFSRLESVLPAVDDLPNIYGQIEDIANSLDLEISNISASTPSKSLNETQLSEIVGTETDIKTVDKSGRLNMVNISVTFTDIKNYAALKNFLDSIEKNIRVLDLISMNYGNNQESYSLYFKTYYIDK